MKTNFGKVVVREKVKTDVALEKMFRVWSKEHIEWGPEYTTMVENIAKQMLRGGKRVRAWLVRLGYELSVGEINEEIVKASLFPELMHAFMLVHDDIADRDLKRYGGPTLEVVYTGEYERAFGKVNRHYGRSMAMVAGDLIQALAHDLLQQTKVKFEYLQLVEQIMAETMKQVVAGWAIHSYQNFVSLADASMERYLQGMKLVSASYSFESPLLIGLALAGVKSENQNLLKKYAYHTGMAFQIQDDILGVFGDSRITGKPVGNDLREGKKTILVLKAYQQGTKCQRKILSENFGRVISKEELAEVQKVMEQTGSLEYSHFLAKNHISKSKQALREIKTKFTKPVENLEKIADFVIERKF